MASFSNINTDNSTLSRIDQTLFRIEGWMALISGLAVFSLIILAVLSVSGRNFFNQPLPGYVDWIEQAMPLIAFTGIAYVQRLGGHIRMDLVIGAFRGRFLWLLELISVIIILAVMLLLAWGSYEHFARSFDFNAPLWSRDSSMDIAIPLWPAKLIAPVAFSVLCLRLVLQFWAYCRALVQGAENPIAVPIIENAAEAASKEAASVSGFDETRG
ncbi:MAG: TRAP transporter small permease [Pseudomonadota bacterium]